MDTVSPRADNGNIPEKKCTGPCGRTLPATTEYFLTNGKGGLRSQCKVCKNKKERERYSQPEVRDRVLAQQRDYYRRPEVREKKRVDANARRDQPETHQRILERAKAYKRRPEIQERRRIYGEVYNSRPDVRERRKAYYQVYNHTYYNRPDVRVRSQAYGNRQRARKKALGTYTPVQIQEKLKAQKYRCYYCSVKFNKKKDGKYIYHIDHTFPLSRVVGTDIPANSIDYLVLACPSCNMSKRNKYPWEWPQGGRLL